MSKISILGQTSFDNVIFTTTEIIPPDLDGYENLMLSYSPRIYIKGADLVDVGLLEVDLNVRGQPPAPAPSLIGDNNLAIDPSGGGAEFIPPASSDEWLLETNSISLSGSGTQYNLSGNVFPNGFYPNPAPFGGDGIIYYRTTDLHRGVEYRATLVIDSLDSTVNPPQTEIQVGRIDYIGLPGGTTVENLQNPGSSINPGGLTGVKLTQNTADPVDIRAQYVSHDPVDESGNGTPPSPQTRNMQVTMSLYGHAGTILDWETERSNWFRSGPFSFGIILQYENSFEDLAQRNYQGILNYEGINSSSRDAFEIYIENDVLKYNDNSGTSDNIRTGPTLVPGVVYHLFITDDGTTRRFFVDGAIFDESVRSFPSSLPASGFGGSIGVCETLGNGFFDSAPLLGPWQHWVYFDAALTPTQVSDLYNAAPNTP